MTLLTEPTRIVLAKGQPVPNDPNFAFNSLLLHGNGTNGSTVITDSSGSPKTVTAVGNAQISTAIADPFGNSSKGVLAFDGTGDYLTVSASNNFVFSDDFTVEGWIRAAAFGFTNVLHLPNATGANNLYINFRGGGTLGITNTTTVLATSPASFTLNQWQHFAVTRSSGSLRVFANGISGTAATYSTFFGSSSNQNFVGSISPFDTFSSFNGYIDELRITKGVARYTANFTPPTAPFPDF